ncbi:MAG TPA: hypothetical protein VGK81_01115 [Anaerolineae bacterium]
MNRLHVRYFLEALVVSFAASIVIGSLIFSLLPAAVGAAFIAGWWANLAAAGTVAIFGGRKAAGIYTDPRLGKVAGTAIGIWTGLGAALSVLAYTFYVSNVYKSDVRVGLMAVFMLVSFVVSLIAAAIAGRETAHPPEEEEV